MKESFKKEGKFNYLELGEGTPIVILHGLMGGLSNFEAVTQNFSTKGYKILIADTNGIDYRRIKYDEKTVIVFVFQMKKDMNI